MKYIKLSLFLFLTLLFFNLYNLPVYCSSSEENDNLSKTVYLTFDDGPSKNTSKILEILKENDVHATFFVIKPYIESHYDLINAAYNNGNAIGNHTYKHEYKYVYVSKEAFWDNFNKQQELIKSITGEECTIFRFPGGSHNVLVRNAHGNNFTKDLMEELKSKGITCYDWNVDSGDAKGNNIPASTIYSNVVRESKDKDGNLKSTAIVLMHDCMTKTTTVEALPNIIKYFKDQGYTFDILK